MCRPSTLLVSLKFSITKFSIKGLFLKKYSKKLWNKKFWDIIGHLSYSNCHALYIMYQFLMEYLTNLHLWYISSIGWEKKAPQIPIIAAYFQNTEIGTTNLRKSVTLYKCSLITSICRQTVHTYDSNGVQKGVKKSKDKFQIL